MIGSHVCFYVYTCLFAHVYERQKQRKAYAIFVLQSEPPLTKKCLLIILENLTNDTRSSISCESCPIVLQYVVFMFCPINCLIINKRPQLHINMCILNSQLGSSHTHTHIYSTHTYLSSRFKIYT